MMKHDFLQSIFTPFIRPIYRGIGHILMFHRICDRTVHERVAGAADIEYPPEAFSNILLDLKQDGYYFLSLNEVYDILLSGKSSPEFISISFDDGYADNYTTAYPILKELGIPFAIYITTAFPDHAAIPWWYLLEDLLDINEKINFDYMSQNYEYDLASSEDRQKAGLVIRNLIKPASQDDLKTLTKLIFSDHGLDPDKKIRELALNWDQLKILSMDPLVTIAAHTINHLLLKNLSIETAREEINGAQARLQEKLGMAINHFAYPFGGRAAAGLREFQLVKEAGFKTATTTRQANIFPEHNTHLESLPRLDMGMYPDFSSLKPALDGWIPARMNRLKRVVTE